MNIKTRKVGRLTEEIKQEFKPYFVDSDPLIDINSTKLGRLNVDGRDYVQTGLAVSILCIYMIRRGWNIICLFLKQLTDICWSSSNCISAAWLARFRYLSACEPCKIPRMGSGGEAFCKAVSSLFNISIKKLSSNWKFCYQSIPIPTLESHELSSMTLEFRRECRRGTAFCSPWGVLQLLERE